MLQEQRQPSSNRALVIDFESTGVDALKERPTEIGVALIDTETLSVISEFTHLIYDGDYPEITPEVEKLTKISTARLKEQGKTLPEVLTLLGDHLGNSLMAIGCVVAYNKDFDEVLLKADLERTAAGLTPVGNLLCDVPWVCAMRDMESNYKYKCWKLSHLAVDKGIDVIANDLHSAMGDVRLTVELLKASPESLADMLKFQAEPWVFVQAQIPAPWVDGGVGRDAAKAIGYSWEKAHGDDRTFEKAWVKRVKESKVGQEIEAAPFRVVRIK